MRKILFGFLGLFAVVAIAYAQQLPQPSATPGGYYFENFDNLSNKQQTPLTFTTDRNDRSRHTLNE